MLHHTEVEEEGEEIKGEAERYHPFEDCGDFELGVEESAEGDGKRDEDDDDYGFGHVGAAELARMGVCLVEPAELEYCEYRGNGYSNHENQQKHPVQHHVPLRIKYAQQDQACTAKSSAEDREASKHLFTRAHVGREAARVAEPPLEDEGEQKRDGGDGADDNEEWFEDVRPDVGYVWDVPVLRDVVRTALRAPCDDHGH